MAVEHNFARGDILRKVLERTGIEAKRPLNLRRGALDQTHGAELLRKLRGYSQNARLLSSKLDSLIKFESITYHETQADIHKRKAGVHIDKSAAGFAAGVPLGIVGAAALSRGSFVPGAILRGAERYAPKKVAGWVAKHPEATVRGTVLAPVAAATTYGIGHQLASWRQKRLASGEQKQAQVARRTRNAAVARKPSPYAQSFHSGEYHDDPSWVDKDIKKSRREARGLSARLDELIEFALPPGGKYPLPVLESAWRRWKKPSRKTLGGILRRHDPRSPIPTMVFRDQAHMLSAKLDKLIQFKEKDESETLIKSRRAGTVGGVTVGAYAGGLLGVEHGSLASGIQGAGEAAQKFKKYAKEDVSRAARKEAERYDVITDRYGAETKLLKDKRRVPPNVVPGPGAAKTSGVPFRETARSATERIGKVAKELPVRAKYAAEDVLHGAGKWLTRSSLSRSIAGGAALGGVVGRYLGTKGGRQLEAAKARRSKELHKARIRRQATDIAKTHAQASAIIESMKRQNLLSAKLDDLINFADPRPRNPQGEFSPQGEGGPDPNAMATVYKMPQQQGTGVGRYAGAALAGGALGATGANIAKAGWTGVTEAVKKLASKRKRVSKIVHP